MESEQKFCFYYKEFHPVSRFNKLAASKDGLSCSCREYYNEHRKILRKEKKNRVIEYISEEKISEIVDNDIDYPDTGDDLILITNFEKWSYDQIVKKGIDLDFENFPKIKNELLTAIIKKELEYKESCFSMICNGCGDELSILKFTKNAGERYGIYTKCKKCMKKPITSTVTSDDFIKMLFRSAKRRSESRNEKARDLKGSFEITFEYISELISKKPYMELLPTLEIFCQSKHDWQMSLDRIDDECDYTLDNTRVVPLELNNRTKWTAEKFQTVTLLANSPPLSGEKLEAIITKEAEEREWSYIGPVQHDKETESTRCRYCGVWELFEEFKEIERGQCKKCKRKYSENFLYFLPSKFRRLLYSCKARCKIRENDRALFDLTYDHLVDIYKKQGGLCYYSGIPFQFGKSTKTWWIPSIERLNPVKGYTKDNIVLICFEFNTTDNTNRRKSPSQGCGAWSKSKFEVFLKAVNLHYGKTDIKNVSNE